MNGSEISVRNQQRLRYLQRDGVLDLSRQTVSASSRFGHLDGRRFSFTQRNSGVDEDKSFLVIVGEQRTLCHLPLALEILHSL